MEYFILWLMHLLVHNLTYFKCLTYGGSIITITKATLYCFLLHNYGLCQNWYDRWNDLKVCNGHVFPHLNPIWNWLPTWCQPPIHPFLLFSLQHPPPLHRSSLHLWNVSSTLSFAALKDLFNKIMSYYKRIFAVKATQTTVQLFYEK